MSKSTYTTLLALNIPNSEKGRICTRKAQIIEPITIMTLIEQRFIKTL